jgi:predicted membrane channel-forming protein YqfA (hemolysin III family)
LFSVIVTFIYFITFYLIFSALHYDKQFNELGLLPFLLGLCVIIPIHKIMHLLPLLLTGTKVDFNINSVKGLPFPSFCIDEKVSKNKTMFSMLLPFITITISAIIGSVIFPNFFHYFSIFSSINFGLSVIDLLFLYHLLKAPRHSFIENSDVGIDILVNQN